MSNSQGHAARRKAGAPANAYGALGAGPRTHVSHGEAVDGAVLANSPRIAMGTAALHVTNVSAAPSPNTLPRPKAKQASADPSVAPGARRTAVQAETSGARYGIRVRIHATHDPAAGPTMSNARIVPSVAGRQSPNFEGGVEGAL